MLTKDMWRLKINLTFSTFKLLNIIAKPQKWGEEITIVFLFIAGVFISLLQFLYNRSLWIDEAMLALNIIHKNSFELLKPLDYEQVAPILFLQIEKLFSILLPHTEYSLRIFPLLCFWLSLYFFYKIVKILWANNCYAIIIALSLVVFNPLFILYSTEGKQYMTDVFVLLAIFYFTIKNYKKEQNKYYVLGIAGALLIFLSNVAPIILFTSGLYLFYDNFFVTGKKKTASLSLMIIVWLGVFSVYYYFFIYEHPHREYMVDYWSNAQAFFPNSFDIKTLYFIGRLGFIFLFRIKTDYIQDASISNLSMYFIMIVLCLLGIIDLIRHKKIKIIILTCVPFLLHIFLSAFQLYPVAARTMLYTLPCMIIICTGGFDSIRAFSRLKPQKKKLTVLASCILFLFFGVYGFPIKREEMKDCLTFINENIKEDEKVYVFGGAHSAFQYYADIEYANVAFIRYTQVLYEHAGKEKCEDGLKGLRGKYWLLFSHIHSFDEILIINQIDSLGGKKIQEFRTEGAFTYLYDFDK